MSAVLVAVVALFGAAWSIDAARADDVRIVPEPREVPVTAPVPTVTLERSQAMETLEQLQRPAMDRALFVRSFGARR